MCIGPLFLGTLQMEPATNWFDESFATILKSHERFARQQRSRPSITYHVTSANSRIDHQLSGIKNIVLMHGQADREKTHAVLFTFIAKPWIHPRHLTIFSNSLIRVSRRDVQTKTLQGPQLAWPSFAESIARFWESTRLSLGSPENTGKPAACRLSLTTYTPKTLSVRFIIHQISDAISPSYQSVFQLSLELLVCYRSPLHI